eukprot:scaffold33388_cov122-Isochrysis_galbana.AAC.5
MLHRQPVLRPAPPAHRRVSSGVLGRMRHGQPPHPSPEARSAIRSRSRPARNLAPFVVCRRLNP